MKIRKTITRSIIYSSGCICFLSLLVSCKQQNSNSTPENPVIINIQPFGNISDETVALAAKQIEEVYPHCVLNKAIPLPAFAYYPARGRYRADSLISFLKNGTVDHHVTIGMTEKDISTAKDGTADWGVMGLGYRPGNSCVVSTFRLTKANMNAQFFKVCIHEIGHTQGLDHCSVKTCFMRDAEGHNPTDEEIEFCPACKQLLVKKGWKF